MNTDATLHAPSLTGWIVFEWTQERNPRQQQRRKSGQKASRRRQNACAYGGTGIADSDDDRRNASAMQWKRMTGRTDRREDHRKHNTTASRQRKTRSIPRNTDPGIDTNAAIHRPIHHRDCNTFGCPDPCPSRRASTQHLTQPSQPIDPRLSRFTPWEAGHHGRARQVHHAHGKCHVHGRH